MNESSESDSYLKLGVVGRCRLSARIGSGGMGVVYRGHHEDLDLPVAVKFLHSHLVSKENASQRFLREARLAARLSHPGIVRVFDCGEAQGYFYIVMEHVDGKTLGRQLKELGALQTGRALKIAEAVAQALGAAYEQTAMIHRDIKPGNILLTQSGLVKVADLGLAKAATGADAMQHTAPGTALGTPNYMSPEQFANASGVDHRADIFSLGATLYQMLAGKLAFDGASHLEVLRLVAESDPDPLPRHIPPEVDEIVFKMLAKRPDQRYQSYPELISALQAAQRNLSDSDTNQTVTIGTLDPASTPSRSPPTSIIPELRTAGRIPKPANPTEKRVLLVVDIQNDFCPGGALAVPNGNEVVPVINKLSRRFAHVILTQDWHCEDHLSFASSHPGKRPLERVELSYGSQILWPDHCVERTPGAEFHESLQVSHCELVIRKGYHRDIDSYSAFYENDRETPTGLAGYLRERGLNQLFIVGLATDFCVAYSALDARRLGFEVTVIEDACRGIDVNGSLSAAWEQMDQAGVIRA